MRSISLLLLLALTLHGCALITRPLSNRMAESVSTGVLNQDDPETVRDGVPAYLLLLDGMIDGDPGDVDLLWTGAKLYGAYAGAFVDDAGRRQRLAAKARGYARTALCRTQQSLCEAAGQPLDAFTAALETAGPAAATDLYRFAVAWAGWIQANPGDWDALADLPKLEAAFRRVVTLDEALDLGGAHLYLGVLASLRPAQLGGQPEVGRQHFERALQLAQGKNLMVPVLYARHYARLVFDQELHDRLLREALDASPRVHDWTLNNVLAQQEAARLLAESPDYF